MLAFSGRGEAIRKQMATFLKTAIELSVYIYIKKVAEKEALLRRGDAIADFCFWGNRSLCVRTIAIPSLRSLDFI